MAVLFFYPGDSTPSCTTEAQDFTTLAPRFEAAGGRVLGISTGTVAAKDTFVKKSGLTIPLLADEGGEMLNAYGVWGENPCTAKPTWASTRTTVLIDPEGRVVQVWPVSRVKSHADEVLAAVERLARPGLSRPCKRNLSLSPRHGRDRRIGEPEQPSDRQIPATRPPHARVRQLRASKAVAAPPARR
jgi:peroxiredoxin Q/BCP